MFSEKKLCSYLFPKHFSHNRSIENIPFLQQKAVLRLPLDKAMQ